MKRLKPGNEVFVVTSEGVIRGKVLEALTTNTYIVETLYGHFHMAGGRVYPKEDFGRAVNFYASMTGVKS